MAKWFDDFDDATRAYVAGKGWDKLDGAEATTALFKAYQNLEKVRPDPARTLTLPAEGDAVAQAAFYQRLGAPKDPSGYTFEGIDKPDSDLIEFVRGVAAELHLPVAGATALAQKLIGFGQQAVDGEAAELAKKITEGTEALKGEWKDAYDDRVAVASNAFEALKWPKETVDALINSLGVDNVMKMGHDLGARMGEGQLLSGDGNMSETKKPGMTRDEALVARNRLMDDKEFGAKVAAGDPESLKQINELAKAIVGTPDNWSSPPPNFGRTRESPYGEASTPAPGQS